MRACSMCYSNLQVPNWSPITFSRLASLGRTTLATTTLSKSPLKCFRSIQYSDAQPRFWTTEFWMILRRYFCFQTLMNAQQHVPNSSIHGITTDMVTHSDVPRIYCVGWWELIPILFNTSEAGNYEERLLFAAHNVRGFDLHFLIREFSSCSFEIPPDWQFLDSGHPRSGTMGSNNAIDRPKVPPEISPDGLSELYKISREGPKQRAMADVNLLSSILPNMTSDLNLGVADLLQRSFKSSVRSVT
ncbi:hypothetical protein D8674_016890 [Pyrus ussuriensis x Pyrus communis]|uniref:Uncharacterized protein n=1 Tax=Pyrus ussuriensis x Pyrus communis TaxID=2448454 RepID=A0A5N5HIA6_9ROSA|nr:hypothetical protein D8674_016890 [Pyrus ussuriensis x Pyrus communis]